MAPFTPDNPQIHDFNPGDLNTPGEPDWFANGGVFWTLPVDRKAVKSKPGRGDVAFTARRLPVRDYLTFDNSVFRNPDGSPAIEAVDGRASVEVRWAGTGDRLQVEGEATDESEPFTGRYRKADATVRWTAISKTGTRVSVDSTTDEDVTISHAFTAKIRSGPFL